MRRDPVRRNITAGARRRSTALPVEPEAAHELVGGDFRTIARRLCDRHATDRALLLEVEIERLAMQEPVLHEEAEPWSEKVPRSGKELEPRLDIAIVDVPVHIEGRCARRQLRETRARTAAG